ncbi:hypothetical protein MKK69_07930 [Methylobacterium sp. J-026]|uniref:hypothetical protein n=1 Tax=Methylobacterium sp. J-026 TaxID=2836624 RepID=UPI001FBA53E1|nr:hypothetical protein [Methylobacterium sp. J-026]MCJ2133994.1 hypothetical protein [Methylobacterium sp. J-026]
MAIYLASFDMRAVGHDYSVLYGHLSAIDAHQAQSCAWLIESAETLRDLSESLLGYLHKDDSLLLIEVAPSTAWAATHLSEQTGEWLKRKRP